jgi:hypothetical protein
VAFINGYQYLGNEVSDPLPAATRRKALVVLMIAAVLLSARNWSQLVALLRVCASADGAGLRRGVRPRDHGRRR